MLSKVYSYDLKITYTYILILYGTCFSPNVTYEPLVSSGRPPTSLLRLTRTSSLPWRRSVLSLEWEPSTTQ